MGSKMAMQVVETTVPVAEVIAVPVVKASKEDVFDVIVGYALTYCGAMPSTREIAAMIGGVTHTTIATRIKALIDDGRLFYLGGHLTVKGAEWHYHFIPPRELE